MYHFMDKGRQRVIDRADGAEGRIDGDFIGYLSTSMHEPGT
jgi:hypothetical protein